MPGPSRHIALQLWTLREHLQTREDVPRTFERLRSIGFEQVELYSGLPLAARELKRIADGAGLGICASHEEPAAVVSEPARVAERLHQLGCRYAVYPQPHRPLETIEQVLELADQLTLAGEVLRRSGQLLTYHNHALEFRKLGGKAILDWLYERSDPVMLHAELDTYWVQAGGADPAAYCARLSGRLPLVHLKDYAIDAQHRPATAALGDGNLNFLVIVREADAAACEHYVIEQDATGADAFEEVARSLRYLKTLWPLNGAGR